MQRIAVRKSRKIENRKSGKRFDGDEARIGNVNGHGLK